MSKCPKSISGIHVFSTGTKKCVWCGTVKGEAKAEAVDIYALLSKSVGTTKEEFERDRLDVEKGCGLPWNKFDVSDDYSRRLTWVYRCYPDHVIIYQNTYVKATHKHRYAVIWLKKQQVAQMGKEV